MPADRPRRLDETTGTRARRACARARASFALRTARLRPRTMATHSTSRAKLARINASTSVFPFPGAFHGTVHGPFRRRGTAPPRSCSGRAAILTRRRRIATAPFVTGPGKNSLSGTQPVQPPPPGRRRQRAPRAGQVGDTEMSTTSTPKSPASHSAHRRQGAVIAQQRIHPVGLERLLRDCTRAPQGDSCLAAAGC